MKIHMEIANGYKEGKIKELRHENPSWDAIAATNRFIADTYGAWITANLGTDYIIANTTEDSFAVDFTYESDADEFQKQLGGRLIEE